MQRLKFRTRSLASMLQKAQISTHVPAIFPVMTSCKLELYSTQISLSGFLSATDCIPMTNTTRGMQAVADRRPVQINDTPTPSAAAQMQQHTEPLPVG